MVRLGDRVAFPLVWFICWFSSGEGVKGGLSMGGGGEGEVAAMLDI